jgi:6-phosphogluconolactonase
MRNWRVVPNLTDAVTSLMQRIVQGTPGRRVTVALSGGSTPLALFRAWGSPEYRRRLDWDRLILFWGDERPVPPEDPESNYGNAYRLWLKSGVVPTDQIHPWPTHLPPEEAARAYAGVLGEHVAGNPPIFDLILLGVGPEGHTASVFPHSPTFADEAWTAAPFVPEKETLRFTFTPRVLIAARQVVFLAEGAGKRDIVQAVLRGPDLGEALPAQWVSRRAEALWILDPEAASGL